MPTDRRMPVSEAKHQLRSAAYFAFGVVALALMLFMAIRQSPEGREIVRQNKMVSDPLLASVVSAPDFRSWLSQWQKVDAYVGEAELTKSVELALVASNAASPQTAALQPPLANRYVWSPDKSKFIDFLSSYGEPDSVLTVFNRGGDGRTETVDFCGTPCGFDGAFWLDESRAVALGHAEGTKADGTPLCVGEGDGQKCYSHLTVTVYDFGKGARTVYVSDNHLFSKNPMAQAVRDRWISGMSQQEREVLGEAPTGESLIIHGRIIDLIAASRILSVATDIGTQRFVTLVPTAVIHGLDGQQGAIDVLHKGATVELSAIRAADGTVMALSARVLSEPAPEPAPAPATTTKKKKTTR